jgi:cytochrome oxidase Cu insertion factor (SCO1/SenC/PrrC family)
MRHRFVVLAVLAALVLVAAGCGGTSAPDQGAAAPATTAAGPTRAPPTTAKARAEPARPAPDGVVPADRRQPAPDLRVTAFDGRTVTMGGFRGQPAVVNFFESW